MITPQLISKVLHDLSQVIRDSDVVTFDAIVDVLTKSSHSPKAVAGAAKLRRNVAQKLDRKKISEIHEFLLSASSREVGMTKLQEALLSRTELVALAKFGSVHVTKSDGIEVIEEKLVESLIGSRLSSAAIRRST